MKKDKENEEKVSDSQKKVVPLPKETLIGRNYGTDSNRRAEAVTPEHDNGGRYERLGVDSVRAQGRPTLGNRWDTLVYEEGLPPERNDDLSGGSWDKIREESDRLIAVAKQVGDYIPSTVWETFGTKNLKESGESIVFLDKKNERVVKFRDPFAYAAIKDDNPYNALYEHHIHNHFFNDVSYRFLGISQDPISGRARFVFEQPLVKSYENPTREEIDKWFTDHGFHLTDDGLFYSDGYISLTDVWNDNCLKDKDGNLRFIDPIVKFEKDPKEVISHYMEKTNSLKEQLDRAGIGVGTRFRIFHLCSDNDREIVSIDYNKETVTLREYNPSAYHDGKPFEWSIKGLLSEIKDYNAYQWIQIDENRKDVVIPAAKKAIIERLSQPSIKGCLTDDQVAALTHYRSLFSEKVPDNDVYSTLIRGMKKEFEREYIGDASIEDLKEELKDFSNGIRRDEMSNGMKR